MSRVVYLNSLQALDAALRHGSMKRAAAELGITPAALGQRIQALEAFTGTPLLHRLPTGIAPTPAATGIAAVLHRAFEDLGQVAMRLNLDRDGPVRIACDSDFLTLWLVPRLPDFHAQFPVIKLAFLSDNDPAPPDLVLAFGTAGQQLMPDWLVPVGSLENLGRLGGPDPDFPLEGLPLLHVGPAPGLAEEHGWPDWIARFGRRRTGWDRGFRYRHYADALTFAAANVGLAFAPLALADGALRTGALLNLMPDLPLLAARNGWMLRLPDPSRSRPNLVQFSGWLQAQAGQYLADVQARDLTMELVPSPR